MEYKIIIYQLTNKKLQKLNKRYKLIQYNHLIKFIDLDQLDLSNS